MESTCLRPGRGLHEGDTTMGPLAMTPVADRVPTDVAIGGLPESRLRRVTEYIQNNLHRELRLAEFGALVHMSPYHFARLFKQSTGVPPHRFLVRRRIERAAALLAQALPIGEIARSVGFRTPSHFATTFRRMTGITPSGYRSGGEAGARQGSTVIILEPRRVWAGEEFPRPH